MPEQPDRPEVYISAPVLRALYALFDRQLYGTGVQLGCLYGSQRDGQFVIVDLTTYPLDLQNGQNAPVFPELAGQNKRLLGHWFGPHANWWDVRQIRAISDCLICLQMKQDGELRVSLNGAPLSWDSELAGADRWRDRRQHLRFARRLPWWRGVDLGSANYSAGLLMGCRTPTGYRAEIAIPFNARQPLTWKGQFDRLPAGPLSAPEVIGLYSLDAEPIIQALSNLYPLPEGKEDRHVFLVWSPDRPPCAQTWDGHPLEVELTQPFSAGSSMPLLPPILDPPLPVSLMEKMRASFIKSTQRT